MTPTHTDTQQEKINAILEAAARCFAQNGFHATSIAQICQAANISTGGLFHYFDNKNSIIKAFIQREQLKTRRYFTILDHIDDPIAALRGFLSVIMIIAADDVHAPLSLEIKTEAGRNPEVSALILDFDTMIRHDVTKLLVRAQTLKLIDPQLNPGQAASWIMALLDGVFCRLTMDPGFQPKAEQQMLVQIVLRFLHYRGA